MRRSLPWVFAILVGLVTLRALADAQDDLHQGVDAVAREDWNTAVKRLTAAIESGRLSDDDLLVAHDRRCAARIGLQYKEHAVEECDRALAIDPAYGPAWLNRGIGHLRLEAYAEAESDLDRALADRRLSKTDQATAHVHRGIVRLRRGDAKAALAEFDRAADLAPDRPEIPAFRGDALYALGAHKDAVAEYDRAIRVQASVPALVGRGRALMALGKLNQAISDLKRAIEMDKLSFDASFVYAEALFRRGEFRAAFAEYERAYGLTRTKDFATKAAVRQSQAFAAYNGDMWVEAATHFQFGFAFAEDPVRAAVWGYLTGLRGSSMPFAEYARTDALKLPFADRALAANQWPIAMLKLIDGMASATDVMKAAEAGDPKALPRQRCEARLFMGEYARAMGPADDARRWLSQAVEACEGRLFEEVTARLALDLLGQ